jgi:cell division protein FtsB
MKFPVGKSGVVALFVVIGIFALVVLRGPNGLSALAEKRKEIQALQEQNATLEADNRHKRRRIEKLTTSREEQELEIRDRLKLLRPGETQFIVPDQPDTETRKAP